MKKDGLWTAVITELELSLSPGTFTTWVAPLSVLKIKKLKGKRLVTIGCPSIFHKNEVEKRYIGQIQELVEKTLKTKCEIKLEVKATPKSEPNSSKTTFRTSDLFSIDAEKEAKKAYEEAVIKKGLSPEFTFEEFAVSSSNEVAYAAAKTVAGKPGVVYHLVFIYGGVGVGKTHLMQAVGHELLKKNPASVLVAATGEEFTNEIIEAIRNKTTPGFREKYRKAGTLLLDDIQFIGGKEKVQEEFFHTFNAIKKEGGQIIITADRLPGEIKGLEDRLKSRFEGGLTVDIQSPGFELRTAILLIKAQQMKIEIPMRVAQMVAANVESTRQLEGVLMKLKNEVMVKKEELTEELASALLNKIGGEARVVKKRIKPQQIIKQVADYYDLKTTDIKGGGRLKSVAFPRQIVMYLLKKELQLPYKEVGVFLGGRDHSTIIYGSEKITKLLTESEQLRLDVASIRKNLYK